MTGTLEDAATRLACLLLLRADGSAHIAHDAARRLLARQKWIVAIDANETEIIKLSLYGAVSGDRES